MAYIKLTRKQRRILEDLDRVMRRSGYKADFRWLEQSRGQCPLCGESGHRPATISVLEAPQAGMTYIPYSVCEPCYTRHFDPRRGGFGPDNIAIIEDRIFGALGIAERKTFWNQIPEQFHPFFEIVMQSAREEGIGFNPVWLQYHTYTCPGCGREGIEPDKAGISFTEGPFGPVIIPYLVCPECAQYTDEALNLLVRERLMEAIGLPVAKGTH